MKIVFKIGFVLSLMLAFSSCDDLVSTLSDGGLTQEEVVQGLKTALELGTDSASTVLSADDGYFKGSPLNAIIPLPDDVRAVRDLINSNSTLSGVSDIIGLDQMFDDVIKGVNRAAEDAASEAAPIFKDAISSLNIADGFDILQGVVPTKSTADDFDSTAATNYLRGETYEALTAEYAPKINASLDKDLVGNVSAVDAWNSLTSTYNDFLNYKVEQTILGVTLTYSVSNFNEQFMNEPLPNELESDLGTFSTELALDELFKKVGQEEVKIRRNPLDWAIDIIQKVFSQVFGEEA